MKYHRTLLLALLAFVFLTILPAALYVLVRPAAGLNHLPLNVLSYRIFRRFFMLCFVLSIVVSSISLVTFISVLKHSINAGLWCYLTSIGLAVWTIAGVLLAGQVNWLHPL